MAAADKSTILLQRSNSWTNRFSKFKVQIDGSGQGAIASGKRERYSVAPGRHVIQVKLNWYKSQPLELDLSEGEEIHLECGTKVGIAASIRAVISPGSYLYLNEAGAASDGSKQGIWSKVAELANQFDSQPASPRSIESGQQGGQALTHIFISYRREDSPDVCGRIYDRLIQKFGKQAVFKDVDSIPFGVDFRTHLDNKVSQCDVLLAVIGDRWLEARDPKGDSRLFDPRDYVKIEIESALKRNIPVIPLLVRGAQMPDEAEIPDAIKPLLFRNGLPIRPDPDFHNDMDRLIEGLCDNHGQRKNP